MPLRATPEALEALRPVLVALGQVRKSTSPSPARIALANVQADPVAFFRDALGGQPYAAQEAMIRLVWANRRTAVVGGHSTGKDFVAGRLLLAWLMAHREAIALVIGPTYRQVDDIVWRETRTAYHQARIPLGGTMFETPRFALSDRRYAVGFSTDRPMSIQGFHSPHLLVLVTEAHSMGQAYIEAMNGLNPERLVLTGNPYAAAGEFYDAFHAAVDRYATLAISAFDTPNLQEGRVVIPGLVTAEDVEERKRQWGEDSAQYQAAVLGQWPDNLEDVVVPRSLLQAAQERVVEVAAGAAATLACDVARFGEDETVVFRVQGGKCAPAWTAHGKDTQAIAGRLLQMAADDDAVDTIVVDDSGVGGGVTDRLREEKRNGRLKTVAIIAFNGGAKARRDDRHVNAITEAWLSFAQACRDGRVQLLPGPATASAVAQFSSRRYEIQGDRRLRLEPKADYKARAGRSPDHADALAMAFSPLAHRPRLRFT